VPGGRAAVAAVMSVAMNPGATAFAVMPNGPSSMARVLVKPCSPALAAEIDCAQLCDSFTIELDEGPRMTARIIGKTDDIACDQQVHAAFTPAGNAGVLPNFALDLR
jgi:hypothetical protein